MLGRLRMSIDDTIEFHKKLPRPRLIDWVLRERRQQGKKLVKAFGAEIGYKELNEMMRLSESKTPKCWTYGFSLIGCHFEQNLIHLQPDSFTLPVRTRITDLFEVIFCQAPEEPPKTTLLQKLS
jgi:hypothetical protein